MKYMAPIIALATLTACGPNPKGAWEGTLIFFAEDGQTFVNEMLVTGDDADVTLYVLTPDVDDEGNDIQIISYADFVGTWNNSQGDIEFALDCDWAGCDYNPTMLCDIDKVSMACDMTPDFYTNDAASLQWVKTL